MTLIILYRIQALSFRVSVIHEYIETLKVFIELLIPILEKLSVFSLLTESEKRKTLFYILLMEIPEILREIEYFNTNN